MIPLVILSCLTADPGQCTQHVPSSLASLAECQSQIEARVVLWSRDHRDQTVTAAYCLPQRPLQGR